MHDYLEKFLLGKLNLELLGDNTLEKEWLMKSLKMALEIK